MIFAAKLWTKLGVYYTLSNYHDHGWWWIVTNRDMQVQHVTHSLLRQHYSMQTLFSIVVDNIMRWEVLWRRNSTSWKAGWGSRRNRSHTYESNTYQIGTYISTTTNTIYDWIIHTCMWVHNAESTPDMDHGHHTYILTDSVVYYMHASTVDTMQALLLLFLGPTTWLSNYHDHGWWWLCYQ